jgi:hypothetical protein
MTNPRPDFFVVVPGFTVVRREYDKDIESGNEMHFDIAKPTPLRINMADVASIAYPAYTDPSTLYYKKKGEIYPQKDMCSVRINSPGDYLIYWLNMTFDEFSALHDQYLMEHGIQKDVPDYFTKPSL